MNYGFIYVTTNLINGKKYIGQHKRSQDINNPDDSWYLGSGFILWKAIEKYGIENFSRTIICECNSSEELNEKEDYFIRKYNAVEDPNYYNMSQGAVPRLSGENHWLYKKHGGHLPPTMRENLCKSQKKRWESPEKRKEMSEKISPTLIGNKRRLGTTQSLETRILIRDKNKGKTIPDHTRAINSKLRTETNAERFSGTIWITDGTTNKRVRDLDIPDGWRRGKVHKK